MSYRNPPQTKEPAGSSRMNTSLKPQQSTSRSGTASHRDGVTYQGRDSKSQDPMNITPEIVWNSRNSTQQQQQNADGTNKSPSKSRPRSPNQKENNNNNNKQKDARAEATAKTQAAEKAAQERAAHLARSHNTVLNQEVSALKEENEQLRDIEKQFWVLLDEREQLQDEVKRLSNGIRSDDYNSRNNNQQQIVGGGGNSKYYGNIRVPGTQNELEKNYTQMAVALDESLNMLIQLDRTAAARFSSSSQQQSSPVLPGSLIYRFLEFCSAERMGSVANSASRIGSPSVTNNNNATNRNPSQIQRDQQQQELLSQMQQNISELKKSPIQSRSGSTLNPQHQTDRNASVTSNNNNQNHNQDHSFSSTIHNSNLSQALRLAQDEIQHLKMELDRSDLSRLQALADVDKLQNQVKVLSSSIVELRSAYSSARAQADANAKSAETVHEVTVRLAERDAEIAHLKARIAEMQRMAASGGSALQADTSRIRQELASRVSSKS